MQLRGGDAKDVDEETARDPLFAQAVSIVLESKRGSVSLLQRRLTIGYSRASRLIEAMAAASILGEHKGSQARQVTMTLEEWEAMQAQAEADAELSGDGLPSPAGVELEPSPDTGAELEEIDKQDAGEEDEEYEYEYEYEEVYEDENNDVQGATDGEGEEQNIIIEVQDTGVGIPKDQQDNIFEAFQQVTGAANREFEGTGLGLAIARQIVLLHGGEIGVENRTAGGTTVSILLPVGS